MTGSAPPQTVKSSERTLQILEHLAAAGVSRSLGELAQELHIPKSSLHGILQTMLSRGWLQTDGGEGRFALGVRALLVGASYVETDDVVMMTATTLDRLADEIGETVHLGRLDGRDIVYLAKRESRHPLRLFSAIGRRLPAHATALGKAILAHQDPETLDRLLAEPLPPLTGHTITRPDQLVADLQATRDRGYAVDDQENTEGIRCIAVPLRHHGKIRDAISCSVPTVRLDAATEETIIAAMRRAQQEAEARL